MRPLRVVELFAGVGGFHLGLAGHSNHPSGRFKVIWFNQWEPGLKRQHAHDVYVSKFPQKDIEAGHTNTDIAEVVRLARAGKFKFPDHDVLVGGFPCQDYSVARTLSQAAGLGGKKGVLWWSIRDILEIKADEGRPVPYVFLENVDRLLKSPASQRGRDFAIMLASLSDLGYSVEWRVINAADYGMPQRRRRIFIVAYHSSTKIAKRFRRMAPSQLLARGGVIAKAFPVEQFDSEPESGYLRGEYHEITEFFNADSPRISPFMSAGVMRDREFFTAKVAPKFSGRPATLRDILLSDAEVPETYYLKKTELSRWKYLKGKKDEPRSVGTEKEFIYKEGPIAFPDPLTKPSRTIVTGEGGATPSRFKHVVEVNKRLRRLTPVELERLCMFPDNHTYIDGMPDARRAFFMGNALVVGVIDRIGKSLAKEHLSTSPKSSRRSVSSWAASPSLARVPK